MAAESNLDMNEIIDQILEGDENKNLKHLSKLADSYAEKAEKSGLWIDFFKAHGLYNACGKRDPDQSIWYHKAYDIECKYYQKDSLLSSRIDPKVHQDIVLFLKRSLTDIRSDISTCLLDAETLVSDFECPMEGSEENYDKKERNFCDMIRPMSRVCREYMVSFVFDIMAMILKIFGNPPCEYAVIAIGSMAKCEVTPFSDLEYVFLIEKEDCQSEFERLAVISYFALNDLMESNLKIYNIKELDRFFDNTKYGFQIDGVSKNAGNIPTGHGPGMQTCNQFIKTVDQMFKLYEEIFASPKAGDLADLSALLASTTFICGNRGLHDELSYKIKMSKPNEARERASLELLRIDIKNFNFLPDNSLSKIKHVKKDFFRFPSIVLYDLKIICQIQATIVWEVIDELKQSRYTSSSVASCLEFLMCTAQYMRLKTYLLYGSQNNDISVLSAICPTADLAYFPQSLFLIMCIHLIPFKNMIGDNDLILETFKQEVTRDKDIAAAYTFYYINDFSNCIKHFDARYKELGEIKNPGELWMYISALKSSAQIKKAFNLIQDAELMKRLPDDQSLLLKGEILRSMGMYKESLEAYLTGLKLFNTWHFASAVGNIYCELGERDKSQEYINMAMFMPDSMQRLSIIREILGTNQENPRFAKYVYEIFLEMEQKAYGKSTSHPYIAASYNDIGRTSSQLGKHSQASSCYTKSLEMMKQIYGGTDHPHVAILYNNIGHTCTDLGHYSQSISYLNKSLEIKKHVYDDTEHPAIAKSYNNIGIAYYRLGEYNQALIYFKKSLEIRKQVYGDTNHHDIAGSYGNIGNVYCFLAEFSQALIYYKKSIDMMEQIYGETDQPDLAGLHNNIGFVYSKLGEYSRAIGYFNTSLEQYKQVFGDTSHPGVAALFHNFAITYAQLGKYSQAITHYDKSLEIMKKVYGGTNHPDIAGSYHNIAATYAQLGEYIQALMYYDKSLEISKQVYGDTNHPHIAMLYTNIGSSYSDLGDHSQAMAYYNKSLEIWKQLYGDANNSGIANLYLNIGLEYFRLGDYCQAISYLSKSMEIMKQVDGGTRYLDIANLYNNMAIVYFCLGEHNQAISYSTKSSEIRKQFYGDLSHPDMAKSYNNTANMYIRLGKHSQAISYFNKELEIWKLIYGDTSHPNVAKLYNQIAEEYCQLGKYTEAASCYKKSLEISMKVNRDASDLDMASTYNNIGNTFSHVGEYKQAITNYSKSLEILMKIYGDRSHPLIADLYRDIYMTYLKQGKVYISFYYLKKFFLMRSQLGVKQRNLIILIAINLRLLHFIALYFQ